MDNLLNEKQVLQQLGIDKFSSMNEEKFSLFLKLIDKMEPEVIPKALEQYPNFMESMLQYHCAVKSGLDKIYSSNKESLQSFYDSCNNRLDSLKKELYCNNLNIDKRIAIINEMTDILDELYAKDTENKSFLLSGLKKTATTMLSLAALAAAAVGVLCIAISQTPNTNSLPLKNSKKELGNNKKLL